MRKFSDPPMIILLDVVFVILFVLALEQSPNTKIILPEQKIEDVIVVSLDKNEKVKHWYNENTKRWEELDLFVKKYPKVTYITGHIACEPYSYCTSLESPPEGEKKMIYVKGTLLEELSHLITDASLKFGGLSSNVTYHISKNGKVDRKRLKNDHYFFNYMLLDD